MGINGAGGFKGQGGLIWDAHKLQYFWYNLILVSKGTILAPWIYHQKFKVIFDWKGGLGAKFLISKGTIFVGKISPLSQKTYYFYWSNFTFILKSTISSPLHSPPKIKGYLKIVELKGA